MSLQVSLVIMLLGFHAYRYYKARPYRNAKIVNWNPEQDAPKVTFLVAAWNASTDIPELCKAFNALSYPNSELVLCAGGEDDSFRIAKHHQCHNIKAMEQLPNEGKQRSLQKALTCADGEIIYLTDVDCRPNDQVVLELLAPLVRRMASVVTGASRPLDKQLTNPFVLTQWTVEQVTQPRRMQTVAGLLGRNAALQREILEKIGGFPLPAPSGTDYSLAKEILRTGEKILFVPSAPMPSEYADTFKVYVRKQARWIRNVLVLGRKYGAYSEVKATLYTLMLPHLLIFLLLLSIIGIRFAAFSAFLLTTHAIANRLYYLRRAGHRPYLFGSLTHCLANQLAALEAGWQALTGTTTW